MKNVAHLSASFYLLFETELSEEEFNNTIAMETIAASEVNIILPNGNTIRASFADLQELNNIDFIDNKEKVTKHNDLATA